MGRGRVPHQTSSALLLPRRLVPTRRADVGGTGRPWCTGLCRPLYVRVSPPPSGPGCPPSVLPRPSLWVDPNGRHTDEVGTTLRDSKSKGKGRATKGRNRNYLAPGSCTCGCKTPTSSLGGRNHSCRSSGCTRPFLRRRTPASCRATCPRHTSGTETADTHGRRGRRSRNRGPTVTTRRSARGAHGRGFRRVSTAPSRLSARPGTRTTWSRVVVR